MECKKSKERRALQKRSIPPKKRYFVETSSSGRSDQNEYYVDHVARSSIPLVVADDRSVVSFGGSTTSSSATNREIVKTPPSSILSSITEVQRAVPFISNDAAFLAKTLQQRDQNEILRASRMMLLRAYMQALHGGEQRSVKNAP